MRTIVAGCRWRPRLKVLVVHRVPGFQSPNDVRGHRVPTRSRHARHPERADQPRVDVELRTGRSKRKIHPQERAVEGLHHGQEDAKLPRSLAGPTERPQEAPVRNRRPGSAASHRRQPPGGRLEYAARPAHRRKGTCPPSRSRSGPRPAPPPIRHPTPSAQLGAVDSTIVTPRLSRDVLAGTLTASQPAAAIAASPKTMSLTGSRAYAAPRVPAARSRVAAACPCCARPRARLAPHPESAGRSAADPTRHCSSA